MGAGAQSLNEPHKDPGEFMNKEDTASVWIDPHGSVWVGPIESSESHNFHWLKASGHLLTDISGRLVLTACQSDKPEGLMDIIESIDLSPAIPATRVTPRTPSGTDVIVVENDLSLTYTVTMSDPWMLNDGTWVVLVSGRSGGYFINRIFLRQEKV